MASDNANRQSTMPAKKMPTARALPVATASVNNSNATAPTATVAPLTNVANGISRLTPARDLTLGGRGAGAGAKKVFAPNLNAVRNKNTNVKTSKDFTQTRGGRRGARGAAGGAARGRGAGNGNSNSSLIQTTGVFSEGAGAVHIRKSTSGGSAYARAGEEVAVSRKRTEGKDEKSQEQRVRELIGSDTSDDDESLSGTEAEIDKTELAFKPVMLKEGLWLTQKLIKPEAANTKHLTSDDADSLDVAQQLHSLQVGAQAGLEEPPAQYGRYPRSIGAFLENLQSQLFVMQLPNVLPCVVDEADDAPVASDQPSTSGASTEQPTSPVSTSAANAATKLSLLAQLEEGQIGKILRYRSGRVKLLLGETRFDLDMGLDSGFLQELMSISTNREQRSGNMINLGPIQAKLKATPDWVHLFEQQEAASRRTANPTTNLAAAATGAAAT